MTDLSPAAKTILNAAIDADRKESMHPPYEEIAAAVLRAAADQVIEEVSPIEAILTIAAELEGISQNPLEPRELSHLSEYSPSPVQCGPKIAGWWVICGDPLRTEFAVAYRPVLERDTSTRLTH